MAAAERRQTHQPPSTRGLYQQKPKRHRDVDGNLVVQINGLDVYDPTTGQVRSSSTDDIACWFIDTNSNGESFFVRHAYFTGADEPYEKLKRALRAEICGTRTTRAGSGLPRHSAMADSEDFMTERKVCSGTSPPRTLRTTFTWP